MKRYRCQHGYSLMVSHDGNVGPPENEYILHSDHAAFVAKARKLLDDSSVLLDFFAADRSDEWIENRNVTRAAIAALLRECEGGKPCRKK